MAELYNTIGANYNSTRRADPHLAQRLFELLEPQEEKLYLDAGCGTGNYTLALAQKGLRFCGVEPSEKMLNEAKARSSEIKWVEGTAEQIPFDDNTFSGAIATVTVHHWEDRARGFAELFRVLKPGSRLVIFTSDPGQMKNFWLNHYFPQMLLDSIAYMPAVKTLEDEAAKAGFRIAEKEIYSVRDDLQDLFLYAGKNNPELYFDPAVRNGISSFSLLSNREEVEAGLNQLRADLDSGKFASVKARYENEGGDYLFLVLEK